MCFGLLQGLLWCVEVPPSILCVACSVYGAGESGCDVVSSDEQAILRLCANTNSTKLCDTPEPCDTLPIFSSRGLWISYPYKEGATPAIWFIGRFKFAVIEYYRYAIAIPITVYTYTVQSTARIRLFIEY